MLYELSLPPAIRSFLVRDRSDADYAFIEDPDRRNDECRMMNDESITARVLREAGAGGAGNLYAADLFSVAGSPFLVRDAPRPDYAFIEDLWEFICLRLDRINPRTESKEYRLQQEKASQLYEKLREMLSEEGQAMLLAYSEAMGAAHYLEVAMLGERAFLDGVRLILRAINNDE